MTRPLLGFAAAIALALLAGACDDVPPSAPQDAPSFGKATSPFECTFTGNPSLSNAANAYFTTTADRKKANDLIAEMQTGFTAASYTGARDKGFDLLSLTGAVSRAGTGGSTANGAGLARQTVQCMFNILGVDATAFAGWDDPYNDQFDFATALGATANGGAFFVRGVNTDPLLGTVDPETAPVVGNDVDLIPEGGTPTEGNISGIAPPGTLKWQEILSNRVLIYGEPVTNGYDWKLIPRSTTYDPSATVGLCPAASAAAGTTADMVLQENVGFLGFVDASGICTTPPPFALLGSPIGSFAMVRGLTRFVGELLAPAPLQASMVALTIGGSKSGAKGDKFTLKLLQKAELRFTNTFPKTLFFSTGRVDIVVEVAEPLTNFGVPVGGVDVTLSVTNNNGFTEVGQVTAAGLAANVRGCTIDGTNIIKAPTLTTKSTVGENGGTAKTTVEWKNACFTKTGAVIPVASSAAKLRTGGVGTKNGPKINVKP